MPQSSHRQQHSCIRIATLRLLIAAGLIVAALLMHFADATSGAAFEPGTQLGAPSAQRATSSPAPIHTRPARIVLVGI
ncbi:MAG: hypothetical protein JWR16_918 [Nevskia sp.]|nr:hypothetical protein [Nevskia sp.]